MSNEHDHGRSSRASARIIVFAGLYESWEPSPNWWQRTFAIIATTPSKLLGSIHDRMSVIVPAVRLDDRLFQRN